MSLDKKILFKLLILTIFSFNFVQAEDLQKVAKFKDWEVIMVSEESNKVCFAQSKPVLQSPKKSDREARLFVTFRPSDKITDEVSITSGYEYNSQNSIIASSGKSKYKFDIAQDNFAWISSNKIEKRIIKRMKQASRIMITAYNKSGSQTIDHYSLMGFTKAYNAAKKSCT
jgi:Invasion associated locus B (IalB) protein.